MAAEKTKTAGARDVDDYLSRVPEDSRVALEKLRQTIKSIVPDAVEVISYQIPTFKYQGRMLVSYAALRSIAIVYRLRAENPSRMSSVRRAR